MKRFLVMCALALPLAAAAQQTASAWSSFKFSCGMNLEWCCGGNNLLWGLYKSGPAPFDYGCAPGGYGFAPPAPPAPCGYPYLATGPAEGNAWAGFGLSPGLGMGGFQPAGYYQDSVSWYGN
jgi:hypothetical protein